MATFQGRRRALISVSDKTGLYKFSALSSAGWEFISTGGTADELAKHDIPFTPVEAYTGLLQILGDRVKTLHHRIHGGLLADPDNDEHLRDMRSHAIMPIALLVVNLYPFTKRPGIEMIDVGGPAMIRAAAKNYGHVTVVIDPKEYDEIIADMLRGGTSMTTRKKLAAKVFRHTSSYDAYIADHLEDEVTADEDGMLQQA